MILTDGMEKIKGYLTEEQMHEFEELTERMDKLSLNLDDRMNVFREFLEKEGLLDIYTEQLTDEQREHFFAIFPKENVVIADNLKDQLGKISYGRTVRVILNSGETLQFTQENQGAPSDILEKYGNLPVQKVEGKSSYLDNRIEIYVGEEKTPEKQEEKPEEKQLEEKQPEEKKKLETSKKKILKL